jgi:hypothetical protein
LIKCVQTYGTAWSDIAAHFAKKGGPFEGRTQVQLKDKARNLKNKWIKYPPFYVAYIVGKDECFRRISIWLLHMGRRRNFGIINQGWFVCCFVFLLCTF